MSLQIVCGGRIEDLAEKLVSKLANERKAKGPFEFLKVAVANPYLGNWLKMKVLAKVSELSADVKMPFKIAADNVTRYDDTPNHKSVREVLANALIHADYHRRRRIVIDKYPRRLSVSNLGGLRISKPAAVSGGTSDARDSKIFNIFLLVKIGERSGMGLSQLYDNWEAAGYAKPQLIESFCPNRTKIEIQFEVADSRLDIRESRQKVGRNGHDVSGKQTENSTVNTLELTETEEHIVSILLQNKHMNQGNISNILGLTRTYVTKIMGELQARKIVRRVGSDKRGHYALPPRYDLSTEDSREIAAGRLVIISQVTASPISSLAMKRNLVAASEFRRNCLAMNELAAVLCDSKVNPAENQ